MNEEETIEYLKKRISILHSNYLFASEQKMKEVLNLIEKQKAEIKFYKKVMDLMSLKIFENIQKTKGTKFFKSADEVLHSYIILVKDMENDKTV